MSSKPYPCEIRFEEHVVVVLVIDDLGGIAETITWELQKISKSDSEIGDRIRLKYGDFPYQTIEVHDKEFAVSLNKLYPYYAFAKRDVVAAASRTWKYIIGLLLLLIGLGVFAFKVIIPSAAEYAATKVPLSIEKQIGESAYNQLTSLTTEDDKKSRLVQEFFDVMELEGKYSCTISVLNSETVNAFAVPGGRIAVYSGIIDEMESSEELAALLAHESSHVELQHSLKSIFRSLSGYFVISLLFGDTGGLTAVVFENLYVFQNLQYSRSMEKEADIRGLECMQKAKINPKGMINLFHVLEKHSSKMMEEHDVSEFMSTHPLTKHRIKYIQEYVNADSHKYSNNPKLDSLFTLIKE